MLAAPASHGSGGSRPCPEAANRLSRDYELQWAKPLPPEPGSTPGVRRINRIIRSNRHLDPALPRPSPERHTLTREHCTTRPIRGSAPPSRRIDAPSRESTAPPHQYAATPRGSTPPSRRIATPSRGCTAPPHRSGATLTSKRASPSRRIAPDRTRAITPERHSSPATAPEILSLSTALPVASGTFHRALSSAIPTNATFCHNTVRRQVYLPCVPALCDTSGVTPRTFGPMAATSTR